MSLVAGRNINITGYNKVERGGGYTPVASSGATLSESGVLVGNGDGNAVMDKTLGDANDEQKSKMEAAKKESDEFDIEKLYNANNGIAAIYKLIEKVVDGNVAINVQRSDGLP